MDERRSIPLDAQVSAPAPRSRGTPIWAQLLVSLLILAAAVAGWAYFYPGARDTLAGWGIALPGLSAPAEQPSEAAGRPGGAAPATADGPPGAAQRNGNGGGQGGPGGRNRGNRTAVVVTSPVGSAIVNDTLTAIGEGSAANSVTLIASASGTLRQVLVAPGEQVRAGAVIAELDAESEQIAFDRAKLAADDAAAALERANELRGSNNVSGVQLTAAQLAHDQAQLELRNAELALERRRIATPIGGTVGLLQVKSGNLVNAQTPITTVEDASAILINFWVPERYASAIQPGMAVAAQAIALPGREFAGEVAAIDNRIDPQSRTLQIQARLDNSDGLIRPGMSFEVSMQFSGDRYASVDPLAIQWSSEGAFVWKHVDGKVEQAMIEIVERNSSGVLVTGDVAEGDQVVTQGVLQLQAGQAVRLLDEPVPAAGEPPGPPEGQGGGRRRGQGQGGVQP